MSAIEVERIGVGPSDRDQVYEVVIDGQVRGCVKCGETRIFEVPPGIHTVKLALDLYSSPPVKVVVGMGKTSLMCQTRQQRSFPFFRPRNAEHADPGARGGGGAGCPAAARAHAPRQPARCPMAHRPASRRGR